MPLDLDPFKPVPDTDGDATQVAGGFTTIEAYCNGNFDPGGLAAAGATSGQALVWNGTAWVPTTLPQPSKLLGFINRSTDLAVSVTSEGSAVSLLTLPAITADGVTPVILRVVVPGLDNAVGTKLATIVWADGATVLGQSKFLSNSFTGTTGGFSFGHRYTPAAGSHTWAVKMFTNTATLTVKAGAGGAGLLVPAYLEARYDG